MNSDIVYLLDSWLCAFKSWGKKHPKWIECEKSWRRNFIAATIRDALFWQVIRFIGLFGVCLLKLKPFFVHFPSISTFCSALTRTSSISLFWRLYLLSIQVFTFIFAVFFLLRSLKFIQLSSVLILLLLIFVTQFFFLIFFSFFVCGCLVFIYSHIEPNTPLLLSNVHVLIPKFKTN